MATNGEAQLLVPERKPLAPLFPDPAPMEREDYVWLDPEAKQVNDIITSLLGQLREVKLLSPNGEVKYVGLDHCLHSEQVPRGVEAYSRDVFRSHDQRIHEWAYVSARGHDIGKLGISPQLLDVDHKYDAPEEAEEMSFHPQLGYLILKSELGSDGDLAKLAASRHHGLHPSRGGGPFVLQPTEMTVLERLIMRKKFIGEKEFQIILAMIAYVDALEATYMRPYVRTEERPTSDRVDDWAEANVDLNLGKMSLWSQYCTQRGLRHLVKTRLPEEIAS